MIAFDELKRGAAALETASKFTFVTDRHTGDGILNLTDATDGDAAGHFFSRGW
jgi:hypothetical protein